MHDIKIAFAICGSFCTVSEALNQMKILKNEGADIYPVMSFNVYSSDTRFGKAADLISKTEKICGRKVISSIIDAEKFGPMIKPDVMLIEPCTGNTLAKLAWGINDTPVTLSAKAVLRNERPLVIAVSSNDALSVSAMNIGRLLNNKNIFFVPMKQDSPDKKPRSVIADFSQTLRTVSDAIKGKQIQPIIF